MDPGQADASLGFPNDPVALTKGEGRVVGGTGSCTPRICSQRVGGTLTPPEEPRAAHMRLTSSVVCCCPAEVENQRLVSLTFLRSVCCLLFSTIGRQAPNQHCLLTSPSLHSLSSRRPEANTTQPLIAQSLFCSSVKPPHKLSIHGLTDRRKNTPAPAPAPAAPAFSVCASDYGFFFIKTLPQP